MNHILSKSSPTNKKLSREETKSEMQTYMRSSTLIKTILDVIREGKFGWLGYVIRRERPSMLHEVVNYKMKGTRPRGRPRTTWLKSVDNQLKEKGSASMKDVMYRNLYQDRRAWRTQFQLTGIHIPTST